jgi:hypothetical protein
VLTGNVGVTPDSTVRTVVISRFADVVVCRDAGQFARPVERQPTRVYFVDEVSVVVVISGSSLLFRCRSSRSPCVGVGLAADELFSPAQTLANVVYQTGTVVVGAGPH